MPSYLWKVLFVAVAAAIMLGIAVAFDGGVSVPLLTAIVLVFAGLAWWTDSERKKSRS